MRSLVFCLLAALAVMAAAPPVPSPPLRAKTLRVQESGGHTYFQVRLEEPADMAGGMAEPRLVPQDDNARLVASGEGRLEFMGRCEAKRAGFVLLYPSRGGWRSRPVVLDFARAEKVALPKEAAARRKPAGKEGRRPPVPDDLEGRWAVAQNAAQRRLADAAPGVGFHDFAARSLSRRYGLFEEGPQGGFERLGRNRPSLYDLTTGAEAMAETLQMERMGALRADAKRQKRTEELADLPGVTVAEHPWKKMMAGKKPAPEPLAGLVPADNWYVAFRRADKMAAFAWQMRAWGGSLLSEWQPQSRDARVWPRYERQMCLSLDALPPDAGAALTGSDAYLREGSDVTLIVRLADPRGIGSRIEKALAAERKDIGDRLHEREEEHEGVAIRSAVTPGREVSLYRARLGEVSLFSNSPAGIRRVIDAAKGKRKRLSDSLDFQYMRTVFRADDKAEDGFAFLSDPFIRSMVGPAMKIKQARRLEGLASLRMLTNGAMLAQWESGRPASSARDALARTGLGRWELPMPEGSAVSWDAERETAVSDAYGTLRFATPPGRDAHRPRHARRGRGLRDVPPGLLESLAALLRPDGLPGVDGRRRDQAGGVHPAAHRGQLLRMAAPHRRQGEREALSWPALLQDALAVHGASRAGCRAAQLLDGPRRAQWHAAWRGPGSSARSGGRVAPAPHRRQRELRQAGGIRGCDSPEGRRVDQRGHEGTATPHLVDAGLGIDRGEEQAGLGRRAVGGEVERPCGRSPGMLDWGPLKEKYKGVSIVRIQATRPERAWHAIGFGKVVLASLRPAFYYALVGDSMHFALNEKMLRTIIDEATVKRDGKEKSVDVAVSLHAAPGAAIKARSFIKRHIEQAIHAKAQEAEPLWHALYSSGVVPADAAPDKAADMAYRWLGFVPVSPDGSAFRWDARAGEVVNERHGTSRKPVVPKTMRKGSPPDLLLDSLESVRADLRFREDGIHATLTMKQKEQAKKP